MSDMTIDAMDLLVDWMYGHLRGNMAFEQCLTLFHISSRCQIAKLQRECVRVLKNYVNPKTVLQLHSLATVHDLCYLQEVCLCPQPFGKPVHETHLSSAAICLRSH